MAVAVYPSLALSVLAGSVIEDLRIGRTELGIAIASISGVAAATSLWSGRLSDLRGGRTTLLLELGLGATAIIGLAFSPSFAVLLGFTLLAGLCSGASNPATNKVLVETVEAGRRGLVTGIKQSGEMVAVVACGVALPVVAVSLGWRLALAVPVVVPVLAMAVVPLVVPRRTVPSVTRTVVTPLAPGVAWLAVYAGFMGVAGNSVITYLPLYAQEAIGMPVTLAGAVLALTGTVAIVGRIIWAELAERSGDFGRVLAIAALLAMASAASMWLAGVLDTPALLWLGAAGWGASLLSFASVAMVAVMAISTPDAAGRASGVVLTGFSIGLMIGPPVFGLLTDLTDAYDAGLAVVMLVLLAAAATTSRLSVFASGRAQEAGRA
jgi:predicted MFS family arabinose efflux permease